MGFTYKGWSLHKARGKSGQPLYFFSKKTANTISLPAGYKVGGVNPRTGLPYLKKK